MYGEDGQPLLTAHHYLDMDALVEEGEWQLAPVPSPPFQVKTTEGRAEGSWVGGGPGRSQVSGSGWY